MCRIFVLLLFCFLFHAPAFSKEVQSTEIDPEKVSNIKLSFSQHIPPSLREESPLIPLTVSFANGFTSFILPSYPDASGIVRPGIFAVFNQAGFSLQVWNQQRIKNQLKRFPEGTVLRPGSHWEIPDEPTTVRAMNAQKMVLECTSPLSYEASAGEITTHTVRLDGINTPIKSIRITFSGRLPMCGGARLGLGYKRYEKVEIFAVHEKPDGTLVPLLILQSKHETYTPGNFREYVYGYNIVEINSK